MRAASHRRRLPASARQVVEHAVSVVGLGFRIDGYRVDAIPHGKIVDGTVPEEAKTELEEDEQIIGINYITLNGQA